MDPLNQRIAQGLARLLTPLLPPGFEVGVDGEGFSTRVRGQWTGSSGIWLDEDDTPERLVARGGLILDGVQNDVIHMTGLAWPVWKDQGSNFELKLEGGVLSLSVQNLRRTERVALGQIPLS